MQIARGSLLSRVEIIAALIAAGAFVLVAGLSLLA